MSPVDDRAAAAGLPPVDSLDMWPAITTAAAAPHSNATQPYSPRTGIFMTALNDTAKHGGDAAIITGRYKLIVGTIAQASWCGEVYPDDAAPWNNTWNTTLDCGVGPDKVGCLFDIYDDPCVASRRVAARELWDVRACVPVVCVQLLCCC